MSGDVTLAPGMVFTASEEAQKTGPWLVPKVRMRLPCPCGGGKRYRDCHGNPSAKRELTIHTKSHSKQLSVAVIRNL
jgi:SEC-C motif-containing protein